MTPHYSHRLPAFRNGVRVANTLRNDILSISVWYNEWEFSLYFKCLIITRIQQLDVLCLHEKVYEKGTYAPLGSCLSTKTIVFILISSLIKVRRTGVLTFENLLH